MSALVKRHSVSVNVNGIQCVYWCIGYYDLKHTDLIC